MANVNILLTNQTAKPGVQQSDKQLLIIKLNSLPLLAGIDESALKKIAGVLQVRVATKGLPILHKGGIGDFLLFLLSGRLQAIDVTQDGREIGLSFLYPGDYFGELSVIDGLPRSATVVACEQSVYALLPRAQALELIYNQPLIAERMFKRLASGIRRASDFRSILGIANAHQRVYALLDYLAKPGHGGLIVIDSLPTQQEISIMVNTSRETVSRAIQILIQRGVLEKDLRRLIVRMPEALREEINAPNPVTE